MLFRFASRMLFLKIYIYLCQVHFVIISCEFEGICCCWEFVMFESYVCSTRLMVCLMFYQMSNEQKPILFIDIKHVCRKVHRCNFIVSSRNIFEKKYCNCNDQLFFASTCFCNCNDQFFSF